MKPILTFALCMAFAVMSVKAFAQGEPGDTPAQKLKRASLPASANMTISSGAMIKIDYSQPALKGRTMGKDVEPMQGQVWRTGANEATVFQVDKDVMIEGQKLPAGKYGLFTLVGNDGRWAIIFNKTWNQWGAFNYKQADDVLRVYATPAAAPTFMERMTFNVDKDGKVSLMWGKTEVDFHVK